MEYSDVESLASGNDDVRLWCESWRFAGEANNLGPWTTVPVECVSYVKTYMTGKRYAFDLEMVSREASRFARSIQMRTDGMDAWVFDIDETLLSNLPYYAEHKYGLDSALHLIYTFFFQLINLFTHLNLASKFRHINNLKTLKKELEVGNKGFSPYSRFSPLQTTGRLPTSSDLNPHPIFSDGQWLNNSWYFL